MTTDPVLSATESSAAPVSPSASKTGDAKASKKGRSALATPALLPGAGAVVLSRIPHGFYEEQMRAYFSQFGEITRLRLSRNRRTGASKHYAFIEFRYETVAKIVAETMNNYLMCGRLLQCQLLDKDQIHAELWKGANRKFKIIPWKKIARDAFNTQNAAPLPSEEALQERIERQRKRLQTVEDRCKELGIPWDASDLN
jgi:nucleolar protein 15